MSNSFSTVGGKTTRAKRLLVALAVLALIPAAGWAKTSTEVGVDLGNGEDHTSVNGATASISGEPDVLAVGIDAGNGDDTVSNAGIVESLAEAEDSKDFSLLSLAPRLLADLFDMLDVAAASLGFAGGNGEDALTNTGAITAEADADGSLSEFTVNPTRQSSVDLTGTVTADAQGMAGEHAPDLLVNDGSIHAASNASIDRTDISIGLVNDSIADVSMYAVARGRGMTGGTEDDTLINTADGVIEAAVQAEVDSFAGELQLADDSGGVLQSVASATAIGMDGGHGIDTLRNDGLIRSTADADTSTVSTTLTFADVTIANGASKLIADAIFGEGEGLAPASSQARAVGMTGGVDGDGLGDSLVNQGDIELFATSELSGVDVSVAMLGVSSSVLDLFVEGTLADASVGAEASIAGISGGDDGDAATDDGHDSIVSAGSITGLAQATADQTSVAVSLPAPSAPASAPAGVQIAERMLPGSTLAGAGAGARAEAAGIDGEAGGDTIAHSGVIDVTADADVLAFGLAVEIPEMSSTAATDTASTETDLSFTLADTSSLAEAEATGIQGGAGDDRIDNQAGSRVTANADSDADATGIAVTAAFEQKGLVAEAVAARAVTDSTATAVGIDGGAGEDHISNAGTVVAEADALSSGVSVSVGLDGVSRGVTISTALADLDVSSTARAVGLQGGADSDTLVHAGDVTADSEARANGESVNLDVSLNLGPGVAGSGVLARTNVVADATAVGVDWPAEDRSVESQGAITARALADTSTNLVNVSGAVVATSGAALGVSLGEANSESRARATALNTSDGADVLSNTSELIADADADSNANAVSAQVTAAQTGLAAGVNATSSSTLAAADASVLSMGAGDDDFTNLSLVDSRARADAGSVVVVAGLTGTMTGVALGGAMTDTSGTATADSNAVNLGSGNDRGVNLGVINSIADATASATGVNVNINAAVTAGVADGVAVTKASNTAAATAEGVRTGDDEVDGDDDDTFLNEAVVWVSATADYLSDAVSASLSGALSGGTLGFSWTDTGGAATADSVGVAAGAGADQVENIALVDVDAGADADATGVSVSAGAALQAGVGGAVSLAEAATTADAGGIGIDTGSGADLLRNTGMVDVDVTADSNNAGVNASFGGTLTGVGAAVGVADLSARSDGQATAVDAGAGADTVFNSGAVSARADSTAGSTGVNVGISGAIQGGIALGGSLLDTFASAIAGAFGVELAEGGDGLDNTGSIEAIATARSDSDAVSVVATGTAAGGAVGGVINDASNRAEALSGGISAGAGDDLVVSSGTIAARAKTEAAGGSVGVSAGLAGAGLAAGVVLTEAITDADSAASGIAGGAGNDVLSNTGSVEVDALASGSSTSVSVNVPVAVQGVALGYTAAETDVTSHASAVGLVGDAGRLDITGGDDVVENSGTVVVGATSEASGVSVAVNVPVAMVPGGAALATSSTHSLSEAVGVATGGGNDQVLNTSLVETTAMATTDSPSVTVNVLGYTVGDVHGASASSASGVLGGAGDDRVDNQGDLVQSAVSSARGSSVIVSLAGGGIGDVGTTSTAESIGIGGESGADVLVNGGTVTNSAESRTPVSNVNVNLIGAAIGDGGANGAASAAAISGGEGDDVLVNTGSIDNLADSAVGGTAVSVTFVGDADADLSTQSRSESTGMSGGSGADLMVNELGGEASSRSQAKAAGGSVGVTLLGLAQGLVETLAEAVSWGVTAGDGEDGVYNDGTSSTLAVADASASSVQVQIAGANVARTNVESRARAVGVDTGADADVGANTGALQVDARSTARAGSVGVGGIGFNGGDAGTLTESTATGVSLGSGDDSYVNQGEVTLDANSEATGSTAQVNLIGAAIADVFAHGVAAVTGLFGDDGADSLSNSGTLSGEARALANSTGTGVVIAGFSDADVSAVSTASATALDGGAGADELVNSGEVNMRSFAATTGRSVNVTFAGASSADASTRADARAAGLSGGRGDDVVINQGSIGVGSEATVTSNNVSVNVAGAALTAADTESAADATGISAGAGSDMVVNGGDITVDSTARANQSGTSINLLGVAADNGDYGANARASGIVTGDGDDAVDSAGTVGVRASGSVDSSSGSFTLIGAASNKPAAGAGAEARGVDLGGGTNRATVAALEAAADADAQFSGQTVNIVGAAGNAVAGGAQALARGLVGGSGSDQVGIWSMDVDADARAEVSASGFSLIGAAGNSGRMGAQSTAAGVDLGDAANALQIADTAVDARATLTSGAGSTVGIGGVSNRSGAVADASATGVRGGTMGDVVEQDGFLAVLADAFNSIRNTGFSFIGGGVTESAAVSEARSVGIDVGAGDDVVTLGGELRADASARVDARGSTTSIIGVGGAAAYAAVGAESSALGIDMGPGDDRVIVDGGITAVSFVDAETLNEVYTGGLFNSGTAFSRLTAGQSAAGLDLGTGADELTNQGDIDVRVDSNWLSRAETSGSFVSFDVDPTATAQSFNNSASGTAVIGAGGNSVGNGGAMTVLTEPHAISSASADSSGIASADGTAQATATADGAFAAGVDLGHEGNTIDNSGSISARAAPRASAATYADGDGINTPTFSFDVGALLGAFLDGDPISGLKAIVKSTIDAIAPAPSNARSTSVATADDAAAYGVRTGSGNDDITNSGSIVAIAEPRVDRARARADKGGSVFGVAATAIATASADGARAYGIHAGEGRNRIWNEGTVTAISRPFAEASSDADASGWAANARSTATATARNALAVGIETGDGDDQVVNTGTVVAQSNPGVVGEESGSVSNNTFGPIIPIPTTDASINLQVSSGNVNSLNPFTSSSGRAAYGIRTNGGDDTVENYGTIVATLGTAAGSGVAVDTGTGDDYLVLGDGSLTQGLARLGSGDDVVELRGTVMAGTVDGETQTDEVRFAGDGAFTGMLSGFERALKSGAGTFVVPSLPTVASLEISGGTLTHAGGYAMDPSGSFRTFVVGDGSFGQFNVLGTGTLDGALTVTDGGGVFLDEATYDIVVADTLNGAFDSESLPTPSLMLSFSSDRLTNAQRITANVESFVGFVDAGDDAAVSLAQGLDGALAFAEDDLALLLGELQRENDLTVLEGALAGFEPNLYSNLGALGSASVEQVVDVTNEWMTNVRGNLFGSTRRGSAPISFTTVSGRDGARGMWSTRFTGARTMSLPGGTAVGFDHGLQGYSIGMDLYGDADTRIGFNGARTYSDDGRGGSAQNGSIWSDSWSLYGVRRLRVHSYLQGVLGFTDARTESYKSLEVASFRRQARARYDVGTWHLDGQWGREFPGLALQPEIYAGFAYALAQADGFTEHGAGGLGLHFDTEQRQRLTSTLGARFASSVTGGREWQVDLAWLYQPDLFDQGVGASFAGAPGYRFELRPQMPGRHGFRITGGYQWLLGDTSFGARLAGEHRNRESYALLQLDVTF